MTDLTKRVAFVLAATEMGPMILNRMDFEPHKSGIGHHLSIGHHLLECGEAQPDEIDNVLSIAALRCKHFGKGVFIVDGGANIGTHTVSWARGMRGWGRVLAIEPQERVFYALCGNITLNNCYNAKAALAAISDKPGTIRVPQKDYREPVASGGISLLPVALTKDNMDLPPVPADQRYETVATVSIDSLNLDRLDILKLDLEGMEPQALDGARWTIMRLKPIILTEGFICGENEIVRRLPDYKCTPCGMNILCIHKDDPVSQNITFVDSKASQC